MIMARPAIAASYFAPVLGLAGLGQAWRTAVSLWGLPATVGETLVIVAAGVWIVLIIGYLSLRTVHRLLSHSSVGKVWGRPCVRQD